MRFLEALRKRSASGGSLCARPTPPELPPIVLARPPELSARVAATGRSRAVAQS